MLKGSLRRYEKHFIIERPIRIHNNKIVRCRREGCDSLLCVNNGSRLRQGVMDVLWICKECGYQFFLERMPHTPSNRLSISKKITNARTYLHRLEVQVPRY